MSDRPDMTSMNVSLPAAQKEYVRERAAATGCSTPSEYIRRLIHEDQKARAEEHLDGLLIAGLESPSRVIGTEEWAELKRKLLERAKGTRQRRAQ